jgi:hypothetical protein
MGGFRRLDGECGRAGSGRAGGRGGNWPFCDLTSVMGSLHTDPRLKKIF